MDLHPTIQESPLFASAASSRLNASGALLAAMITATTTSATNSKSNARKPVVIVFACGQGSDAPSNGLILPTRKMPVTVKMTTTSAWFTDSTRITNLRWLSSCSVVGAGSAAGHPEWDSSLPLAVFSSKLASAGSGTTAVIFFWARNGQAMHLTTAMQTPSSDLPYKIHTTCRTASDMASHEKSKSVSTMSCVDICMMWIEPRVSMLAVHGTTVEASGGQSVKREVARNAICIATDRITETTTMQLKRIPSPVALKYAWQTSPSAA
mmetsp:Transcript_1378/g.4228  ORF Transcript_1378/g.4228 Transcript_1378/m.4228 type:complete len:266 (+) Transcript_1378:159-956(+)